MTHIFPHTYTGDLAIVDDATLVTVEGLQEVHGDLTIEDCPNFTTLPDGLEIEGSLTISGCPQFTARPKGLKVGGIFRYNGAEVVMAGSRSDFILGVLMEFVFILMLPAILLFSLVAKGYRFLCRPSGKELMAVLFGTGLMASSLVLAANMAS